MVDAGRLPMNRETQDIETRLLFPRRFFLANPREQVLRRPAISRRG